MPHIAIKLESIKFRTLFFLLTCFAAAAEPPSVTVTQNAAVVGSYNIYELTMTNIASYANPWEDPAISAVFTAPSGSNYTVGGFYFATNAWKLRFAPRETGAWTWALSYSDSNGVFNQSGNFACTNSSHNGFLRLDPANVYNFITDAQSNAFRAFGFQEGWASAISATWPTDISQLNFATDGNAQPTTIAQALLNAKQAGFNMIRINTQLDAFDHLSPYGHFNLNNTGKNECDLNQGLICDELLAAAHQLDFKCLMSFWNAPGNYVPNSIVTNAEAPTTEACLRYHQYIINRFGAYVDIWELCNESTIPQSYVDVMMPFIRTNDPYQHLITMNGSVTPTNNFSQFDVWTFHAYYSNPTLDLVENGPGGRGLPVFDEECGNAAPFGSYDPLRYRLLAWTGFFQQTSMLFWGYGGGGLPHQTSFASGGISNESIGWEEQLETKILMDFASGLGPAAVPVPVTTTPAGKFNSYALAGVTNFLLYITHSPSGLNFLITNATATINVPTNNMLGQWIDPKTGNLLKTITVNAGSQTIPVPGFVTDIALRLQPTPPQSVLQFSSSVCNTDSGQTNITLTVYRLGNTSRPASVTYSTCDGLALAGVDYVSTTGALTWAANDVSPRTINVPLLDIGNTLAADKQFTVALSDLIDATPSTASTALVMIVNTAVNTAVFDSATYAVPMAATNAVFTLDRLGNGNGPLTVYFSTRDGTATAGTDYVPVNPENLPTSSLTPVTWADDDLSPKTVTVQILNSGSTTNKTFVVALDDGLAPRVAASGYPPWARSTVVILATNTTPSPGILTITGYTNEVGANFADTGAAFTASPTNSSVTFQVSRTQGSSGPVSISYSTTSAGSAEAGADYTAVNGTLTWTDGDTTNKTFTVPVFYHPSEIGNLTEWVQLSNPTNAISGMPYAALLTIPQPGSNDIILPTLIVQQPSESLIQGQSATLSVVVSGTQPMTYQWQDNGTNIPGATNATYTISDVQLSNAGSYTVTVANPAGSMTTTAAAITVSLFAITGIELQGSNAVITWTAPPGSTNYVQASSNLTGNYTNISPPLTMTGSMTNYMDIGAVSGSSPRFYRIELPQ